MWGLDPRPVTSGDPLLATPVAAAVDAGAAGAPEAKLRVAEIDPAYADTADLRDAYGVPMDASVNCVVVAAKRAGQTRMAACLVRASTRADVNGVVRRHLGARKASFAPQDEVVAATGMEYGGITPIGLPDDWPILVDSAALDCTDAVVGSGLRGSKLIVPGPALADLPGAEVVEGLAVPAG
ncbi:prolyl-tRNA editing enzyme YbaK/EbsC (Cys-tRNA(Pro) deacylase) [Lipingzhangella halophila]|uniref:Prolyl-tRNA editing enzyme YbaK/EbsC (Cys-tRNA(Pro) deacylase) n=1 Tax=Lipingzhangella halophila TaxID=1783352 RepID=A0A7W7RKJ6_9ACTN|nr:YbaK/EbsC family protein [Lipingzhangella halophila]MBB4933655.1 prolyl-tRNA editing enzyme YbaK/EbsC (Cys-tRNA(Pro) deacylase) [Lipingzhangella halophila]